jgi:hypothetical protein
VEPCKTCHMQDSSIDWPHETCFIVCKDFRGRERLLGCLTLILEADFLETMEKKEREPTFQKTRNNHHHSQGSNSPRKRRDRSSTADCRMAMMFTP